MEILQIWYVGDQVGFVYETLKHIDVKQGGPVSPVTAKMVVKSVEGWNVRPWLGDKAGWVATRKENKK